MDSQKQGLRKISLHKDHHRNERPQLSVDEEIQVIIIAIFAASYFRFFVLLIVSMGPPRWVVFVNFLQSNFTVMEKASFEMVVWMDTLVGTLGNHVFKTDLMFY